MTVDPSGFSPTVPDRLHKRSWVVLALILVCFWILRGPVMLRQMPAQDEDYFAAPGEAILQNGVPRIPYLPGRNPEGAFYRADEVLYALPPLYFYWQACVYSLLGASTGNARVASALAGSMAILFVYLLGLRWLRRETAALWGAGLYAASRILYFPCLVARPDMLCALWGIVALWAMTLWRETGRLRWLTTAGGAVGLGLLTHPFAVIFALQVGVWSILEHGSWRARLRSGLFVTGMATVIFALWLPLVAIDPELFRIQLANNVLGKSGPGLFSRLLWPWDGLRVQVTLLLEYAGWPLLCLLGAATAGLGAGWISVHRNRPPRQRPGEIGSECDNARETRDPVDAAEIPGPPLTRGPLLGLILGGIYLHIALQGIHPTKGYWVYTLAPCFVLAGGLIGDLCTAGPVPGCGKWSMKLVATLIAAAVMLPGCGLRTLVAHLQNWDDINYSAPRFTQQLLSNTPSSGRQVVDPAYVFDFYRAGRNVVLALNIDFYFDVTGQPYDLLVAGRDAIRKGVPQALGAVKERSFGDPDDLFACYAEIYRPAEKRPRKELEDEGAQ